MVHGGVAATTVTDTAESDPHPPVLLYEYWTAGNLGVSSDPVLLGGWGRPCTGGWESPKAISCFSPRRSSEKIQPYLPTHALCVFDLVRRPPSLL